MKKVDYREIRKNKPLDEWLVNEEEEDGSEQYTDKEN